MPTQSKITDKLLFTPGPLTTSEQVKSAMVRDLGSRDTEFITVVSEIRRRLLSLAGQDNDTDYTAVLMQGSGTFGVESVISSAIPRDGKLLLIINGAYGKRIKTMADIYGIETITLTYPENTVPCVGEVQDTLAENPDITTVAIVHCETTTGILNPIEAIGDVVSKHNCVYIVDAMSSFGAIPIDVKSAHIDYLVSSANKCIEGVPGFSFAIASLSALRETKGYARTLSLDLYDQWMRLERDGQFRFTPPVQTMLAFYQALLEIEAEGGVSGRGERYRANHDIIIAGMTQLGFQPYLDPAYQSIIITTFYYPDHANFDFETFYNLLSDKGYVIYPGKLTEADCFRIGNIGRMGADEMRGLLSAIEATLDAIDVDLM